MELKIASNVRKIKEISNEILRSLDSKQVDNAFLFDIRLACEEAIINAIKHGNKCERDKIVTINFELTEEGMTISVEDEGEGFDYKNLPDPREMRNLLRKGGRGLFLIRKIMDKVEYNEKGNKITMTKFFPKT